MDGIISIKGLNLSDEEAKYVRISRDGVCLRFPLRHSGASGGADNGKRRRSDAHARFQEMMTALWDEEVGKKGVSLKARINGLEAEFFKEAAGDEEVRNAVLSLLRLKRRFDTAL